MTIDRSTIRDEVAFTLDRAHGPADPIGFRGIVEIALTRPRRSAAGLDIISLETAYNLVTEVGDEYLGERAAGIASPPDQATGMRLGSAGSGTAVAKTSTGAAIVNYITGSNQAFEGGSPSSTLSGSARRIQWQCVWVAGDSTNATIDNAVITNETPLTNVAGTAANTLARVVFTDIDKGALDTLTITWSWDIQGS